MIQASLSDYEKLVTEGYSVDNIARALGENKQVVKRKLSELNLSAPKTNTKIYGLTNNTFIIRAQLGAILTHMNETMSYKEISIITGIIRSQITNAMTGPFDYDWTLSQIERTLAHEGKTIYDITRRSP